MPERRGSTLITLPFEEKFNKVNALVTIILFFYTIVQLVYWAIPDVDSPPLMDNIVTGVSFGITVCGYIYYWWQFRKLKSIAPEKKN